VRNARTVNVTVDPRGVVDVDAEPAASAAAESTAVSRPYSWATVLLHLVGCCVATTNRPDRYRPHRTERTAGSRRSRMTFVQTGLGFDHPGGNLQHRLGPRPWSRQVWSGGSAHRRRRPVRDVWLCTCLTGPC